MKSKNKEKHSYSSKELSIEPTPSVKLCGCGDTEHKDGHCDGSHKKKSKPRKMINRKAIQAEIDIDKKIRQLIESRHYNLQQIAGMWSGVTLERVKKIHSKLKQNG